MTPGPHHGSPCSSGREAPPADPPQLGAPPTGTTCPPSGWLVGIHRVVGTFLGLGVVAVLLLPAPWQLHAPQDAPALVIVVIFLQFTTELFMTRHYGLAMVSFTPVIVLATQLAALADPYALISERAEETLVGATIGVIVLMVSRRGGSATSVPGSGGTGRRWLLL